MKRTLAAAFLLQLLWQPRTAGAQQGGGSLPSAPTDVDEFALEELLGTVDSASRKTENLFQAPASVYVIDARAVRLSGSRSVPDLLRRVPGVQVFQASAGSYVVALRGTGGLQGNNVVVLLDGLPVNSAVDASVDWAAIPVHVDDIERIEVVRGPVSSIHGANAYTGVINIITRKPPESGSQVSAWTGSGVDSAGELRTATLGTAGGRAGALGFRLAVSNHHDRTTSIQLDDGRNPAFRLGEARGQLALDLGETTRLVWHGAASRSQRSSMDHLVVDSIPQTTELLLSGLSLEIVDEGAAFERGQLWVRGKRLSIDDEALPTSGFSYDDTRALDGAAGFDAHFRLIEQLSVGFGANAGLAHVDAPYIHPEENDRSRSSYGFYGSSELDIADSVIASASLRSDLSALSGRAEFSYRGTLTYYRKSFATRLSAGSAYREPSYVEVGGRFVSTVNGRILLDGTPGLRSPRVESIEASLVAAPAQRLTVKPILYVARLSDLMVEDFEPLVRKTFRNDREHRDLLGAELEVDWGITDTLRASSNLAWIGWLNSVRDVSATVGVPEHNSRVTAYAGLRGTFADERLGAGIGANLATERSYQLRAGIPPELIDVVVPTTVSPEAAVDYRVAATDPIWIWTRATTSLPHAGIDAPFPESSVRATTVMLGVDLRGE